MRRAAAVVVAVGCRDPSAATTAQGEGRVEADAVSGLEQAAAAVVDNATYRIQSEASGLAIDLGGDPLQRGAMVVQNIKSNADSQLWQLVGQQEATYLVNRLSRMCLGVSLQSREANATLQQWDCNQAASQRWTLRSERPTTFTIAGGDSGLLVDVGDAAHAVGRALQQRPRSGQPGQAWQLIPLAADAPPAPVPPPPAASAPALAASSIYVAHPEIFSAQGDLGGVAAGLGEISRLGFRILCLMPVTPVGRPVAGHPAFGSPYAVHDHLQVAPSLGGPAALKALVAAAHRLGMQVILDQVLASSAWDSPLLEQHPEFYRRSDDDHPHGAQIGATSRLDGAQLDYRPPADGLQAYMIAMLTRWLADYDLDGFRFPDIGGPDDGDRAPQQAFWQAAYERLRSVKPSVIMVGGAAPSPLALAPFQLDHGVALQAAVAQASRAGSGARLIREAWEDRGTGQPAGMLHANILGTWEMDADAAVYGGSEATMAAAALNLTLDGIPLLFNGQEVGNTRTGPRTRGLIDWKGPRADETRAAMAALLALRGAESALQQGALTWLDNSAPDQVLTYLRQDATRQFLVAVNVAAQDVAAAVAELPAGRWIDRTPAPSPGGRSHRPPPDLLLKAHDYAIFVAQ